MNDFCITQHPRLARRALAILLLIILLLSLLRLVPPLRERAALKRQVQDTQAERNTQLALQPLFAEILAKARVDTWSSLIPPEQVPLHNDQVAGASLFFEQVAEAHSFTLGRMQLRVLPPPPQRLLSVTLPMQGTYANFGPLLQEVLRLPALQSLDRIAIRFEDTVETFTVELTLALE